MLFSAEGALVVGTDVNSDGGVQTVELVRATGGTVYSTRTPRPRRRIRGESLGRRPRGTAASDILYNNAGATRCAPIGDTSYEDWSFTIRKELDIVFLRPSTRGLI